MAELEGTHNFQKDSQPPQPEVDRNYILIQYEYVLQQLNAQVQKLLAHNQELEQANVSNEMVISQSKQVIGDLQATLQQERGHSEQKIVEFSQEKDMLLQELDKHKNILKLYCMELDTLRQQNFEQENRFNQQTQQMMLMQRAENEMRACIEELNLKCRTME